MQKECDIQLNEKNDLIWHFTARDALHPILRDGILGTHQAFMNDLSDCLLSRRVAIAMSKIFDVAIDAPKEEIPVEYKEMILGLRTGTYHSMFLTCFSKTVENPLLWRCYTSQGGFAIGVSESELRRCFDISREQLTAFRFKHCSYDDWSLAIHKVEVLEVDFEKRCERLKDASCSSTEKAALVMDSIAEVLQMEKELAFYKDPFFKGEHEVRVLYTFNDPVPLLNLIVIDGKPRIKIPLLRPFSSLVKQIKVSPFGDKMSNFNLAQLLAASVGLPLSKVEMFEAPIR